MTRMKGFTLVEMAIVLMIVALLLGGLLAPLSTQLENQRFAETERLLADVRDALNGFAVSRGRLPCPAKADVATGSGNAGQEDCSLTGGAGVVPWADLGLRETDAWGRRFTYRVTMSFADNTDGTGGCAAVTAGVSFQLCSEGDLTVKSASSGGSDIGIKIPAAVVAHGPNGFGAWLPSGSQLPTGTASADEQENFDADKDLVSHGLTSAFDDQVMWLSRHVLFNRMVTAARLP